MQSRLITSAYASVTVAIAGIVAGMLFLDTHPNPAATPYEQGQAAGAMFGTMIIHALGIVAAIVALRAVKKQRLSKINLYVALAGLVVNLAALAFITTILFHSNVSALTDAVR